MRSLPGARRGVLDRVLTASSVLLLVCGVATISLNAASRFLLDVSLTWSAEAARYLIVWSALLGAAVLVGRRQHLSVAVELGGTLSRITEIMAPLASMIFFSILAVSGALLVRNTAGQVASSIGWLPMSLVYAIVPVTALVMWRGALRNLLCALEQERDPPPSEPPLEHDVS